MTGAAAPLPVHPASAIQADRLVMALMFLGAVRLVGPFPFLPGLIAPGLGLLWLFLAAKVQKTLLPSYLLVGLGALSGAVNGVGPRQVMQLLMVLGGLGIAEYFSRRPTSETARILARRMIWVVLALTAFEYLTIQIGLGQRMRELSGDLVGGLLPGIDITVPRFMGIRGGSGYSGLMAGVFALICLTHGYRRAALLYGIVLLLMVSRGPLLGLIVALGLRPFLSLRPARLLAMAFPLFCIASPLIVAVLQRVLSDAQILFLIEVSTRRFLHYMSFLHFGLENPIFGVGYANYHSAYAHYFYDADFQQWGLTNFGLIRESHNFMLDVLGEMGVLAYLLAAWQMWIIARIALSGDARFGPLITLCSVGFLFLSGLSDWTWWFAVGVILSHARAQKGGLCLTPR